MIDVLYPRAFRRIRRIDGAQLPETQRAMSNDIVRNNVARILKDR
jgi:hypothetical protein